MEVVAHRSSAWFLLQQDCKYYIDVNCESGFVSFSALVQLNSSEKMHYESQGIRFIENLAEVIAGKAQISHPRNIKDKELLDMAHESIMEWKSDQT